MRDEEMKEERTREQEKRSERVNTVEKERRSLVI